MKKLAAMTLFSLIAAAFTGCAHQFDLPPIGAKNVTYKRTDPFGGTTITAKNVVVTPDKVTAEQATWSTHYPSFNLDITVDGYERPRPPSSTP